MTFEDIQAYVAWGTGTVVALWAGFVTVRKYLRDQDAAAIKQAREIEAAVRADEEADCARHLARMDAELGRLGKRLDNCEERHDASNELIAELATRFGMRGVAERARSITPGAMKAVDPEPAE